MNLAHVERYFSDFLSGFESGEPVLPNLELGSDGAWRERVGERAIIELPTNLLVIGTVNVDETTYMFSPKVLDRAFTFEVRTTTSELSESLRKPTPALGAAEPVLRSLLAGGARYKLASRASAPRSCDDRRCADEPT